ncbi:amidase [Nocardioides anomalus]|uniref:Amidase n=1 Tax=Nocardioides anomalus TaxID=2712223 RepID=A0A6G6WJL1_9ACTN|nr:amidase family protein [Nocardioides anomalus]QIG45402.1 amidase [Nocardioides anomalus]
MDQGPAEAEVARLLALVAEVDPQIASVNALGPDALAEARALDEEAAAGRTRSPLHGRAVLVKDNVDTAGLASTAGSLALAGVPPAEDAPLVQRLRAAGMVVLGKANLSEWANIRDPHSTSGWSAHGGLTRNPYALNRTAWGSSSGSAAAVAARLAPYAVGTETDGSISMPAAACGVVGLKPTVGRVPTSGVVPISSTQDAPGPMALTVAATTALYDVLAGATTDLGAVGAPGRRVGVPRSLWGYSPAADAAAERALGLLAAAGVEVVDDIALPALDAFDPEHELTLMLTELVPALAAYLAGRGAAVRTLDDVVAFNRAHADRELSWFGQGLFERALATDGLDSPAYAEAQAACRAAGIDELDRVLAEHRLDALVAPTTGPATPLDLVNGDSFCGGASTPSALAGAPILSVPLELVHGLPVALALWGARGGEATLLGLGAAVEAGRDGATGPLPEPAFPEWI